MKGHITHELPGRMRIRFGAYAFTKKQGYTLEERLGGYPSVLKVTTEEKTGSVLILYKEGKRESVLNAIRSIPIARLPEKELPEGDRRKLKEEFVRSVTRTLMGRFVYKQFIPVSLNNVRVLWKSFGYFKEAWKELREAKITIPVLDGAAILCAILQGDFTTASNIMFFLRMSEILEEYTTQQVKADLKDSLSLHVDKVWMVPEDGAPDVLVPFQDLRRGDRIRLRQGAIVPVDGVVTDGLGMTDESSMTGESRLVEKKLHASVYAGTILEEGEIVVSVQKMGEDTRLHSMLDLIDQSAFGKSKRETMAIQFANRIVPYHFLLTGLVFLTTRSLSKTMATLMVDYSCAMKISAPLSTLAAIRTAAEHDILVKGGKYLENLADADTFLFDKTGTLTKAMPCVSFVKVFEPHKEEDILRDAACIEEHFPHSMAQAITREADERGISHEEIHGKVHYIMAHGIRSSIGETEYLIGSRHFLFEDEGVEATEEQLAALHEAEEKYSCISMAIGGKFAAFFAIEDPPREEAKRALKALKDGGIRRLWMLTGDNPLIAGRMKKELGLDHMRAQVLPQDKAQYVRDIRAKGVKVAMVGDGMNDSPALAAADVSIAMKDASELAREVADMVLLRSDLMDLVRMRELAKKLRIRIDQNMQFILIFNSLLLGGGLLGLLTPTMSSLLHNASTFGISLYASRRYPWPEDKDLDSV